MKRSYRLVVAALLAVGLASPGDLPAATLFREPYLQNVRPDRAVVMWATVESGAGVVQYSTDRSFSRSVTARTRVFLAQETGYSTAITQYEAELTGLLPNTEYSYRVLVDGQDLKPTEALRFRTSGPGPFAFLALGDTGQATLSQSHIADRMFLDLGSLVPPNLVVHTGDIAYFSGTYKEFQTKHFDYYVSVMKRVPFFLTPGNHEYVTDHAAPFIALHSLPADTVPPAGRGRYYSFDWGNVHFVCLDGNEPLSRVEQGDRTMVDWLEKDLEQSRQFWRVVYWHQAPYATGENSRGHDHQEELARQYLVPIMDRYDVPLVLNGHEHSYQRSYPIKGGVPLSACPTSDKGPCLLSGTQYITTGGGGADLYRIDPSPFVARSEEVHHYLRLDVQGSKLMVRAIGEDGLVFDSITLAPPPQIAGNGAVNAASFAPGLAPGALVSVFGRFLSQEEESARSLPLPQQMSDAQVTLNGQRLPLLFVSARQINLQLPFDVVGTATLRVITTNGFSEATVNVAPAAPGVFFADGQTPAVTHADGKLVTAASPALPGETVSVYMTGLGTVTGEIAAGAPAPSSPLLPVRAPVTATLGGISMQPSFAGLAPGFAGLYQVNIRIPQLSTGIYPLVVEVAGVGSNPASLQVRSSLGATGSLATGTARATAGSAPQIRR
jgi:uncharacterized protein (TIGR03437 family)